MVNPEQSSALLEAACAFLREQIARIREDIAVHSEVVATTIRAESDKPGHATHIEELRKKQKQYEEQLKQLEQGQSPTGEKQ